MKGVLWAVLVIGGLLIGGGLGFALLLPTGPTFEATSNTTVQITFASIVANFGVSFLRLRSATAPYSDIPLSPGDLTPLVPNKAWSLQLPPQATLDPGGGYSLQFSNPPAPVCTPPRGPEDTSTPDVVFTACNEDGLKAAVAKGGKITFDCGPAPRTIVMSSSLLIPTSSTPVPDLVIDGGGLISLDGLGSVRIVYMVMDPAHPGAHSTDGYPRVVFQNLNFLNGRSSALNGSDPSAVDAGGAAIWRMGGRLELYNCGFYNHTADLGSQITNEAAGGALFAGRGSMLVVGCTFVGCSATGGGAIAALHCDPCEVYNTILARNEAVGTVYPSGVGAGMSVDGNGTVMLCGVHLVTNNATVVGGGFRRYTEGLNGEDATLIDRCYFEANTATNVVYSALFIQNHRLVLQRTTLAFNQSPGSTSFFLWLTDVPGAQGCHITDCVFFNNTSGGVGGVGFWASRNNTAPGAYEMANSVFVGNTAPFVASAWFSPGGADLPNVNISSCLFSNAPYNCNLRFGDGGGNFRFGPGDCTPGDVALTQDPGIFALDTTSCDIPTVQLPTNLVTIGVECTKNSPRGITQYVRSSYSLEPVYGPVIFKYPPDICALPQPTPDALCIGGTWRVPSEIIVSGNLTVDTASGVIIVEGNFSLSPDGILVVVIEQGSGGVLQVAGCVHLDGILVLSLDQVVQDEQSFTIFEAADGCFSGSFRDIVVNGSLGLRECQKASGHTSVSGSQLQVVIDISDEGCGGGGGLNNTQRIIVITAVVVGGVALIAGAIGGTLLYLRRRKQRQPLTSLKMRESSAVL